MAASIDPALARRIPAVDGYTVDNLPDDDVLWRLLELPPELVRHDAVVMADGEPVGRLTVAAATDDRPAIDTFVERTFADAVYLPNGPVVPVGDESSMVASNAAVPVWTEMEGNAVIRAEQEIDGTMSGAGR